MTDDSDIFRCKDFVGKTDDFKDNIKEFIPGASVHFDEVVKNAFPHTCPASSDIMFIESDRAIYTEFKSYTIGEEKNEEINQRICNKIACTAMIHHRFLKGKQGIPEYSEFWVIGGQPSEEYISIFTKSSNKDYTPPIFDKFKCKDSKGRSLFFDQI